ncbi:hypothetical protein BT63DRAFT_452651 [Microthyrium microscopicum]|uniref:HOOK N-terminal domain-containing protein n=1 Tax=Microthyrium microscopicum TaxID=703497 RepID=A0A6A6UL23_9PEZI|nr:hypothetical protein BT63DRAFT_452651 [Microthyrium microscopicum]
MEKTPPELDQALLLWINSFKLPSPVKTWAELADGATIWTILADIDPDYFHDALPEDDAKSNDNWIPRWQNWKFIEKEVLQYIRDECGRLTNLGRVMHADLKAIATESSKDNIVKVVECVLLASMYSDHSNERMIGIMGSLGPKVAGPIAAFIGGMEELNEASPAYGDTEPSSDVDYSTEDDLPKARDSFERDPELEREERLIQAIQEKKKFEAHLTDALAELDELREHTKKIEDELEESKYALDRRRGKSLDAKDFAQLNERADQDRQYIEELEADLASTKSTLEQQERQLERFKTDSQNKQELRDELQLVTTERDELRQKAKANENLRKKIHTLQEQEKSTQALRQELQAAQDQLQDYDSLRERCFALEKANEENAQTIANGEQEIIDQKTAKRMLEYEVKNIAQKWEQSKELLANAQDTIRELQDGLGDNRPTSPGGDKGMGSLDDELNAEFGVKSAESKSPKQKEPSVTAESIVLQQKLNIAASSVERLEKRCLDLLQENLGFKAVIDDADAHTKQLHPFQHQAKKLEELARELEASKSKFITASSQITDLQQRLEAARGKSANDSDIVLQANQERQQYITDLEQTLRDQRNLLRHALLSAEALQKIDPSQRWSDEFKLIKHQLETISSTPATEAQPVIKATANSMTDRIESVRGTLSLKETMLAEREAEFVNLQSHLDGLKMRPPPVPPKDEPSDKEMQKTLQQLQRENKLIASAWYDITCRLQSNTVHLARRADGGRSWLSRMRTSVNTTSGAGPGKRI